MKIDDILKHGIGKTKELTASFRQVVASSTPYETTTYHQTITVELGEGLTGIETDLALGILNSQLEYNCLAKMLVDGAIGRDEYDTRVQKLEAYINALLRKAEKLNINTEKIVALATDEGADPLYE